MGDSIVQIDEKEQAKLLDEEQRWSQKVRAELMNLKVVLQNK
jgi:hypothetical protein